MFIPTTPLEGLPSQDRAKTSPRHKLFIKLHQLRKNHLVVLNSWLVGAARYSLDEWFDDPLEGFIEVTVTLFRRLTRSCNIVHSLKTCLFLSSVLYMESVLR